MRLCLFLFSLVCVVLVILPDTTSAKRPKLTKKCRFEYKIYKKGQVIQTYKDSCLELRCEQQEGTKKAVMALHEIEHCKCGKSTTTKDHSTNLKQTPKRKKRVLKCTFNDRKYRRGATIIPKPDNCMELKCVKVKKTSKVLPVYTPDCTCAGEEDHHDGHWSYHGDTGPDHWPDIETKCGGQAQSPINFVKSSAQTTDLGSFNFMNYDVIPTSVTITNNGHSAQASFNSNSATPSISGGGLLGEYEFLQVHFHWGKSSDIGSEHTIEGRAAPLEMHLVHWKKEYGSLLEAIGHSDGLAVLGIMFEISNSDNAYYAPILTALGNIHETDSSTEVTPALNLHMYLPDNLSEFYRYSGSLTTPTCNEAVVWTVFPDTIKISETQMHLFRQLLYKDGSQMVDNFRPVQPLHGRNVLYSAPAPTQAPPKPTFFPPKP